MENFSLYITLIGIISILIAAIILLNIVETAFNEDGLLWGIASVLFPIGTYKYCCKKWNKFGKQFIITIILSMLGAIFTIISITLA